MLLQHARRLTGGGERGGGRSIMAEMLLRTLLVVLMVGSVASASIFDNMNEAQIFDYLLQRGYDKRVMPKLPSGGAVVVTVDLYVRSISSVNEISMQFDTDLVVRQRWSDPSMEYTMPTSYDQEYISGDDEMASHIWRSDMFLANSKRAYTHLITQPNTLLWLYPNGTVMCNVRISSTFMCQMKLETFPFDTQYCEIQIGSFGHTDKDIQFVWKEPNPIDVNRRIQLPQYKWPEAETINCFNPHWTGNFSCLKLQFKFEREFGYHMSQSFAPCALLVICSWVSFWLSVDAIPARTALGITTFLTIYTQSSGVRYTLPPVSYTKAIDIWFNVCTVFIFLTLVEFALVNYVSRHYSRPSPKRTLSRDGRRRVQLTESVTEMPAENGGDSSSTTSANTTFNARPLAPSERRAMFQNSMRNFKRSFSTVAEVMEGKKKAKTIDVVSRILFPVAYLVFIIIYTIRYGINRS